MYLNLYVLIILKAAGTHTKRIMLHHYFAFEMDIAL